MKEFEVGDRVGLVDESLKGTVKEILLRGKVLVLLDHGIEIPVDIKKLVNYTKAEAPSPKTKKSTIKTIPSQETEKKTETADFTWEKKPSVKKVREKGFRYNPLYESKEEKPKKSVKKQNEIWEIDLHIQELTEDWRHLSNAEIVNIQLGALHNFVEKAMVARIRKIVIIHGVGKGKLRQEVKHYLERYANIHYYDATYGDYGSGATTAEIFYEKKISIL